jgi:uncharacterized protein (DUF2252 family)
MVTTRRRNALGSPNERAQLGMAARELVPPEAHATVSTDGRDPVGVLAEQIPSRLPELVPVRHERMSASPFAFFRGAAAVMAADLARSPHTGLQAQLCGDAHLSNFGTFASPERHLLFDINDFDETYPGPWEWDLKRLAASLVVAGRENDFSRKQIRKAVLATVGQYRDAMAAFARQGNLEVWYARVDIVEAQRNLADVLDARMSKRFDKAVAKAKSRDHRHSLAKLTEVVDGHRRIIGDPPFVVPISDLTPGVARDEVEEGVERLLWEYTASLAPGHRDLARSYTFVDMARKVVGVGSVGTRCWIVLMRGRDDDDPLFLQIKEAQSSVLAGHLSAHGPRNEGARVVSGQRVMQAASDIFLGWQRAVGLDGQSRDFYVRQLHDWKGSVTIERMVPEGMRLYGQLCGWTLARAHARSGDRIAIAAYLGDDDHVAQAVADFAEAYADLNERDHAAFVDAVASGRLTAAREAMA